MTDPQESTRLRVGPPERIPVPARIERLAQSADGSILAGARIGDGAIVWHRDRPEQALHLKPHKDCRTVAVSPDGKLVATGAHNAPGLKVWDAATGQLLREFLLDTMYTWPSFSADGNWLYNQAGESWRVRDWTEGPPHPGGKFCPVTSDPQCRLAACGGNKGFIPLIDPATGRELARLEDPHQDGLLELTFSRDGALLIGITNDSSCVRVWDLRKIRQGLDQLGLDWAAPPYPPAPSPVPDGRAVKPLQIEIVK
jgi:WD40 repeat protein